MVLLLRSPRWLAGVVLTGSFLAAGLVLVVGAVENATANTPTPIVMWHGMGDSCCFPFSLGSISKMLRTKLPNVYVRSLRLGAGSLVADYESGFFLHPNAQVSQACAQLAADERLRNGYNALGFSQGGQFLRAVAQRCPEPPMLNLVSLGGQHQGVFGLPNCPSLSHRACEELRRLLNRAAYTSTMQQHLVQATYWHDPLHEDVYRNGSTFLADINNERVINSTYVENLQRLKKLILVKFSNDTIVDPRDTSWFEFYAPGQDTRIEPLIESDFFKADRLGLRDMMAQGRLQRIESPGNHLQFTQAWFDEHILPVLRE